ncbi:MAG: acyl-CoA thioesterase [Prevotellaceae bacterium]|jgi:acyl-CoA thioester hydrolase|nr:acyl-CoA thioesterase [Prevotellaceae bacterium]
MLSYEMTHRVAYYETDVMGYVHHSNYVRFFEIARTELMRTAGYTYAELEASGIMMPIIEVHSRYYQPGKYDDLLTFRATIKELQGVRLVIEYEVLNEAGVLLCTGSTTLAFIDAVTRRPCRAPEIFVRNIVNKEEKKVQGKG